MAKCAMISSSYCNIYHLVGILSPRSCHLVAASTHFLKPSGDPHLGRQEIGSFLYESRRLFAKSRKKWDDDDDCQLGLANGGDAASRIDIGPIIKQSAVSEMEAGIEAVSNELTKLRTGRASPAAAYIIISLLLP